MCFYKSLKIKLSQNTPIYCQYVSLHIDNKLMCLILILSNNNNNNNNSIIVYSCAESTTRCPIIEPAQHTTQINKGQ